MLLRACLLIAGIYAQCTKFYDRDDPSATGDWELAGATGIPQNPIQCPGRGNERYVEARVKGTNTLFTSSGAAPQVVTIIPAGLFCRNNQNNGRCYDYEIRFCCRRVVPQPIKTCSRWFNSDSTGGTFDIEVIGENGIPDPPLPCPNALVAEGRVLQNGQYVEFSNAASAPANPNTQVQLGSNGLSCAGINGAECLDYEVRFCCIEKKPLCTDFFDRDNPGGTGDWEHVGPTGIPEEKINIDCAFGRYPVGRVRGTTAEFSDISNAPQTLARFDANGLVCKNDDNKPDFCKDYEVKFCCILRPPCTKYYDRDNPSGTGDWELMSLGVLPNHPKEVFKELQCENTGGLLVEGREKGNTPTFINEVGAAITYNQVVTVNTVGLFCQNYLNPKTKMCLDYEVRFCCLYPLSKEETNPTKPVIEGPTDIKVKEQTAQIAEVKPQSELPDGAHIQTNLKAVPASPGGVTLSAYQLVSVSIFAIMMVLLGFIAVATCFFIRRKSKYGYSKIDVNDTSDTGNSSAANI